MATKHPQDRPAGHDRALVIFGLGLTSLGANAQVEQLYGTWRLLSWTREVVGTGERTDSFGKAPHGVITYGRDGRMSAIIVRENRPKPTDLATLTDQERAELFKTMLAYAGTFTVDGGRVVRNVDISWNESWTGTAQKLTISTDPQVSPIDGKQAIAVLIWDKVQ